LPGRTVECYRERAPRPDNVGELREHEGRGSPEVRCFGDGGEKLGKALSAELRAGGYRGTELRPGGNSGGLTLRVAQVAASDLHSRSASYRVRPILRS
jgi:hypothetical protein